jgi:hypothetical protein
VGFVLGFLLHLAIDALVFGTALGLGLLDRLGL